MSVCGRCGQRLGLLAQPSQLAARYPGQGWILVDRPMPDRPLCDLDPPRTPALTLRKPTTPRR